MQSLFECWFISIVISAWMGAWHTLIEDLILKVLHQAEAHIYVLSPCTHVSVNSCIDSLSAEFIIIVHHKGPLSPGDTIVSPLLHNGY